MIGSVVVVADTMERRLHHVVAPLENGNPGLLSMTDGELCDMDGEPASECFWLLNKLTKQMSFCVCLLLRL